MIRTFSHAAALAAGLVLLAISGAQAFCGFYVARADGDLFNATSKVVYTRDGRRSTITMSSDYHGPASEFAMIVPTPRVLRRNQIRTVSAATLEHLDAYTAPRLVEYHDDDPCAPLVLEEPVRTTEGSGARTTRRRGARALGVTIRAEYAVGEYDILILDARQSDGLMTWLNQEGYSIPDGAEDTLGDYIGMGMKFFVARVNLARNAARTAQELTPLQMSFRAREFMLPIQLGKVNADGPQDLILMTLTKGGRVEVANYPTAALPSNVDVPVFVEDVFADFYQATFSRAIGHGSGIVLEYGWDMAWCDPCAADPLSNAQLSDLGVTWLKEGANAGQDVYVTRLHARYTAQTMQEDLMLRVTNNRDNFQGRYAMRHPWRGSLQCQYGVPYQRETSRRLQSEAETLHRLTGWAQSTIRHRIRRTVQNRYLR